MNISFTVFTMSTTEETAINVNLQDIAVGIPLPNSPETRKEPRCKACGISNLAHMDSTGALIIKM